MNSPKEKKFIWLYFIITNLTLVTSSSINSQTSQPPPDGNFHYTTCDCSWFSIYLDIHHGLVAPYGGQFVVHPVSKGAVTVANLNDTDHDTTIDKDDNDVSVVGTSSGRNEVDLMKLVIRKVNTPPPGCTHVEISSMGAVKFWETPLKQVPASLSIPMTSLPKTIWVEATAVSSTVRDITITAEVGGIVHAEVKATAIWAEFLSSYKTRATSGSQNASPLSYGLDDFILGKNITDIYAAGDNSLYGFETLSKLHPPEQYAGEDVGFGGRLVMRAQILPHGIQNELSSLGIKLDFGRKIYQNIKTFSYTSGSFSNTTKPWPAMNEESNDDGTSLDEDLIPWNNAGYTHNIIFSYDAPSHISQPLINWPSSYLDQPHAFVKRDFFAKEYVRVSFGDVPDGNGVVKGSICSAFYNWELHYSFSNELWHPNDSALDPYAPTGRFYKKIQNGLFVGWPRRFFGGGTAPITAQPNLMSSTSCDYLLLYDGTSQTWMVTRKENGTTTSIGTFPIVGNIWTINDPGRCKIIIDLTGHPPFQHGTYISVPILNDPTFILNSFN